MGVKEILEKLTSYNLFNYLLSGVVFVLLASKVTRFSFVQQDIVTGAFLYYFIGLVISRVGSLVIEPALKAARLIKFADYGDFVAASRSDSRIEVLSEANNTYRTLCSTFVLLLLLKGYDKASGTFPQLTHYQVPVLLATLMFMFLFAYRKQSGYITKRVASTQANATDQKGKAATA